jgi:prepilin-type processing-associated H-X9-DG protein
VRKGLNLLADKAGHDPAGGADLRQAVRAIRERVEGDQVQLEADLEHGAALVTLPVRRMRETASRAQCVKNLKQLALGLHNYHSAHKTFPAAYNTGPDGKPLLSWRVHILPFLDSCQDLYNEFHLDEPWDGPHNLALIPRMPKVYACPSESRKSAGEGKTTYLVPRGPATIFPGARAVPIQEVTDGTSNTILIVDASDEAAVPWTKPDDWGVAQTIDPRALFGHHPHPDGTNFAFGDGSVRFLKRTIAPRVLEALTTRNGNEVISADGF